MIFFTGLLFLTTTVLADIFTPYEAHIDTVEAGQFIQVFSKAGETLKTCEIKTDVKTKKSKCKNAVAKLGLDAKITVESLPFKANTIDTLTDEAKIENYVKIKFEYDRLGDDKIIHHQVGEAFTEEYNLSRSEYAPFYGNKKAENDPKKKCPPDVKNPNNELSKTKSIFEPLYSSITYFDLNQKAEKLSDVVGFCPLRPPSEFPNPLPKGNPYDQIILPRLKKKPVPRITKENGESMSQQDLINIDSLARTLYGEMAICYKYGLQYPMTVAKMIINREQDKTKQSKVFLFSHRMMTRSPTYQKWLLQQHNFQCGRKMAE